MARSNIRAALEPALRQLEADIARWREETRESAVELMEDIAQGGEDEMEAVIETSITPTGLERAEREGGYPGRIVTDNMRNAIEHSVEVSGDEIVAKWGWPDPEEYFIIQDQGLNGIEGMEAVERSLNLAELDLQAWLRGA